MRPDPYSIHLAARPLRAAFVIDSANCPIELLDDLFKVNYLSWGGRLRPIVAATAGVVGPLARRLLLACDPDVIYSYCELTPDDVEWIDRHIQPWLVSYHRMRPSAPGQRPDYRPDLQCHPVPASAAMARMFSSGWLEHHSPTVLASFFLTDGAFPKWFARNFGSHHPQTHGGPRPNLTVESDWDDTRVLSELAHVVRPLIPACAAASRAKFFRPRRNGEGPEYCIVVGDTTSDWLMFWNLVFTIEPQQWELWHTLCVPADRFDDPGFVVALHAFLGQHATRSGSGPPPVYLRSTSVDEDTLRRCASKLDGTLGGRRLDAYRVVEALPKWGIRAVPAADLNDFPILDPPGPGERDTVEQQANTDRVLLRHPNSPLQLSNDWVLDLDVEFQSHGKFFTNESLWWALPKRRGLASLFVGHLGRVNGRRSLSYLVREAPRISLHLPEENTVLRVALLGHESPPQHGEVRMARPMPFEDIRLSDKGKYVQGVVDLLGGLQEAATLFGNSYWRSAIDHLCHRGSQAEESVTRPIVNRLRKQRSLLKECLEGDDFELIAASVLSAVRAQPSKNVDTTWRRLESQFIEQRRRYLADHPDFLRGVPPVELEVPAAGRSAEEARSIRDLQRVTQEYVDRGVFFQGVRYRCQACGLAFWRASSDVTPTVDCDGCRAEVQLAVEAEWTYRLNTLVKIGVANHGVVPVIWTLSALRHQARSMFCCLPGVELRQKWDDRTAAAELDVVCIRDGKLLIGEVKSSAREFSDETLQAMGQLADSLAADVLLFAAFETDERRLLGVKGRCETLFPQRRFSVEVLWLDTRANEPTPDPSWSNW